MMVGMRLQGGVEVDLLGKDDFDGGLQRLGDRLAPKPADRSVRVTRWASGIMPVNQPLILDLGSPPSGCLWAPVWLTIFGTDDRTSVVDSVFCVYMGGEAIADAPLSALLIPGGTKPQVPAYVPFGGKDHLYAHFGDHVFIKLWGADVGSQFGATLRVREVHPSNIEELNLLV